MGSAGWMGAARRGAAAALLVVTLAAEPALADTSAADSREAFVTVMGVVSPYATFGLLKHLSGIPGVASVTFDLAHGIADVHLRPGASVTDQQFRDAIRSASYTAGDIRRKSETSENLPGGR